MNTKNLFKTTALSALLAALSVSAQAASYTYRIPVSNLSVQASTASQPAPPTAPPTAPPPATQYALQYNGSANDALSVVTPNPASFKNGFSAAMQVYSDGVYTFQNPPQQTLFAKTGEFEVAQFSDGTLEFALDCNWNWIPTGAAVPLNQWSAVGFSYTASTGAVLIAIDGKIAYSGTACANIGIGTNPLDVGARSDAPTPWTGKIEQFALWGLPLSSTQLQSVTSGTDPLSLATGLIVDLPLTQSSGTTVTDQSGNGNNGTLQGTVNWATY